MKAVLLSIKPKYCELIASGKKTMELRKTRPQIDVPFKVYIYCTLDNNANKPDNNLWIMDKTGFNRIGNGKVIGEFVCDTYVIDKTFGHNDLLNAAACLTVAEAASYCINDKMYGWHISDLQIYDKPKGLREFCKPCVDEYCYCEGCKYGYIKYPEWAETAADLEGICYDTYCLNRVQRPPQSWCYVEEEKVTYASED